MVSEVSGNALAVAFVVSAQSICAIFQQLDSSVSMPTTGV
jgi:hypothetical protein